MPANKIITLKRRIYGHEIQAPLCIQDGHRAADLLKPGMAVVLIIGHFIPRGKGC